MANTKVKNVAEVAQLKYQMLNRRVGWKTYSRTDKTPKKKVLGGPYSARKSILKWFLKAQLSDENVDFAKKLWLEDMKMFMLYATIRNSRARKNAGRRSPSLRKLAELLLRRAVNEGKEILCGQKTCSVKHKMTSFVIDKKFQSKTSIFNWSPLNALFFLSRKATR